MSGKHKEEKDEFQKTIDRIQSTLKEIAIVHSKHTQKNVVDEESEIEEIERALGLDSIQPIHLTPSDAEDTEEKEQELKDWYEHELKRLL